MPPDIKLDAAQQAVALRLDALAETLRSRRPARYRLFGRNAAAPPRGLYIWGDVGRGKTMLMDAFFEAAEVGAKRRLHFNAFMVEVHARIHEWRRLDDRMRARRPEFVRAAGDDPIPPVARALASSAALLCFDEFHVRDVADAMILGRLFEQLLTRRTAVVATSNTPPDRLYEGGLNRQLFLPFISLIEERFDVVEVGEGRDYRLGRMAGLNLYVTPLGPQADTALDAAWSRLTDGAFGHPEEILLLGRTIRVPRAAHGVARFSFDELCARPLGAADYLAIARHYHVVLIDRIPQLGPHRRDEARRFTILVDTLYDRRVKLVCSAAAPAEALFPASRKTDEFRRLTSRLLEMQSLDYLQWARRPLIADTARTLDRAGAG